jgi:serine protease Do
LVEALDVLPRHIPVGAVKGDVIVSANNQAVIAPTDVAKAWTDAQGQKRPVLLRVKREDQYLFIAVEA